MPASDPGVAPRQLMPAEPLKPLEVERTRQHLERPTPHRLSLLMPDGARHFLGNRVALGQSGGNDIVLRDPLISRRHCIIELREGRPVVRDLESTNGTFVNGVRVPCAELQPGSSIVLGATRLRIINDHHADDLILGQSLAMVRLRREIARLASSNIPVLIHGETGTGKELVARALHDQSGRRGQFVPINCGSIPQELIESELFGHERGAFTGANARRAGLFQEADEGTLFLDEIGELPALLQSRLLRVLETGVVRPVGCNREVTVNVRTIAATHVNLERAVAGGRFRHDLYYRLAGHVIVTPPLRARPGDIRMLAQHILSEEAHGASVLSETALAALENYHWPGNVRELKNVLKRAAALGGAELEPKDLMLGRALRLEQEYDIVEIAGRTLKEIERDVLSQTLRRCGGNQRLAADELKMAKSSFNDKLRRYGIACDDRPRRLR